MPTNEEQEATRERGHCDRCDTLTDKADPAEPVWCDACSAAALARALEPSR